MRGLAALVYLVLAAAPACAGDVPDAPVPDAPDASGSTLVEVVQKGSFRSLTSHRRGVLYWGDNAGVVGSYTPGGTTQRIDAKGDRPAASVLSIGTSVFWLGGELCRVGPPGVRDCAGLRASAQPFALAAADSRHAFVSSRVGLYYWSAGKQEPRVIGSGLGSLGAMAYDDSAKRLYVASLGQSRILAMTGLYNSVETTTYQAAQPGVTHMRIVRGALYWTTSDGRVMTAPALSVITPGLDQAWPIARQIVRDVDALGIALDETYVYWSNYVSGTIARARLDGAYYQRPEVLAHGLLGPSDVEFVDGYIYWIDDEAIKRMKVER